MTSCEFCDIIAHRAPATTLYEDADTLAFFPLRPATLGHTLLIPKVHIPHIWELTSAVAVPLMERILLLSKALRDAVNPHGLNVINSAGEAASQTVFHLHVHLVPRWNDDSFGNLWPHCEPWAEQEKVRTATLIRTSLSNQLG